MPSSHRPRTASGGDAAKPPPRTVEPVQPKPVSGPPRHPLAAKRPLQPTSGEAPPPASLRLPARGAPCPTPTTPSIFPVVSRRVVAFSSTSTRWPLFVMNGNSKSAQTRRSGDSDAPPSSLPRRHLPPLPPSLPPFPPRCRLSPSSRSSRPSLLPSSSRWGASSSDQCSLPRHTTGRIYTSAAINATRRTEYLRRTSGAAAAYCPSPCLATPWRAPRSRQFYTATRGRGVSCGRSKWYTARLHLLPRLHLRRASFSASRSVTWAMWSHQIHRLHPSHRLHLRRTSSMMKSRTR